MSYHSTVRETRKRKTGGRLSFFWRSLRRKGSYPTSSQDATKRDRSTRDSTPHSLLSNQPHPLMVCNTSAIRMKYKQEERERVRSFQSRPISVYLYTGMYKRGRGLQLILDNYEQTILSTSVQIPHRDTDPALQSRPPYTYTQTDTL